MRNIVRLIVITASLACFSTGQDVNAAEKELDQRRTKVGLVLSGGGARGAAHIGVLKVLEANRIPIDYIAGTSMGSIVGGLYAVGMTPDEIEDVLASLDWDNIFVDEGPREDRTFRRKRDDLLYLIDHKLGVKDGDIKLRGALVQGQQFDLVLRKLTLRAGGNRNFDKLWIPFRAVATDIITDEQVILGSGDLAAAVRASMTVPAAFSAVEIEGRLLVDGGLTNNLPINVVRDMGADIIIAVDISTPLYKREELGTLLDIAGQMTGFLTRRNTERQILSLSKRDILITPDLRDIKSGDFHRIKEIVPYGIDATEQSIEKLKRLSLSKSQYVRYLDLHPRTKKSLPVIQFIRVDNPSVLDDEVLSSRLDLNLGEPLDIVKLEKGVGRIYGLGIFENVSYEIVEEAGREGLVIHAREKSWGTDGLQFGLELSADFEGDTYFNIGSSFTKAPLNSLNGEWRSIVQIGEEPTLFTEIYQPLDTLSRYYIKPVAGTRRYDVRVSPGGQQLAQVQLHSFFAQLWAGYNFDIWGRISLGLNRSNGNTALEIGDPTNPALQAGDFESGDGLVSFKVDTLNDAKFPRRGYGAKATWRASREGLGADTNFNQARIAFVNADTWGKHTLIERIRFDTTDDSDAPAQDRFRLGGFLNLSGFQQNELGGQQAAQLMLAYMSHSTRLQQFSTYIGASLELGNTWEQRQDISVDNSLVAGSVFLGWDTPLGPVYLAYGQAEGGHNTVYMFVGQPWGR